VSRLQLCLITGLIPSANVRRRREALREAVLANHPRAEVYLLDHADPPFAFDADARKVIVGHSFGAWSAIEWAGSPSFPVIDAFVLLDPVSKEIRRRWTEHAIGVPVAFAEATCFHRPRWVKYPMSKRIETDRPGRRNVPLSIGHDDFYDHPAVVAEVLRACAGARIEPLDPA
jgi:hypothetical protein